MSNTIDNCICSCFVSVFQKKVLLLLSSTHQQLRRLQNSGGAIQGFSLALENPCDSTRDVRKLNKKLASPDFRNALVRIIILGYLN